MNILFYHEDETCPTAGGIQRSTSLVADGLSRLYGHRCFNVYDYPADYPPDVERYHYEASRRFPAGLPPSKLAPLLREWEIDVIVNQQMASRHANLRRAIEMSGRQIRLIYALHSTPRRFFDLSFRHYWMEYLHVPTLRRKLKRLVILSTYPLYAPLKHRLTFRTLRREYRQLGRETDAVVLLSRKYLPEWEEIAGESPRVPVAGIPNMLSFGTFADETAIVSKEKRILIVSRLLEYPKNLLAALRIWKRVSADPRAAGWTLDIVGEGPDRLYLQRYVRRHSIPGVKFHGRQPSAPYYSRSALFMMTSLREGWGMTLTEAMQNGCVPIVFDSYAAVRDIITPEETGILVTPFDEEEYASRMLDLMADFNRRCEMAIRGVADSRQFTPSRVLGRWQQLLLSLQ